MDTETVSRIEGALGQATCTRAENEGGFLRLGFGDQWLSVGCAWRIILGESIHGSGSKPVADVQLLVGKTVESLAVSGETNDLRLELSDRAVLETFEDSGDYENWTLGIGDRGVVVSGPGKSWSSF